MNMDTFDLFLFDMDGTLVNTENLHYKAYQQAFNYFKIPIGLTFDEYCKYAHYNESLMENYVAKYSDIKYADIYTKKKFFFIQLLDFDLKFIDGAENLLTKLFSLNKKTCIVTHSDSEIIKKICTLLPILNKITKVITKNDYKYKKPFPECYIKALNFFPECVNPIGFEDSYKGYTALFSSGITSVYIGPSEYYYYKDIAPNNTFVDFNCIDWTSIKSNHNTYNNYLDLSIDRYTESLDLCRPQMKIIISQIIPLIKNSKSNIYLSGIGKCGHVAKKCVSTWQSVGISCHYLNIPDLFHGDFGILQNNDIIIYISNSGNTEELIKCCSYIKNNFNVLQICFTIKMNNDIKKYVDFHYNLAIQPILEIDTINMAPTTSSILFMTLLDIIGVKLGEEKGLTIEKFRLTHPGGELGKITNNIIDYVVIVASGAGTRLMPLSRYIPKILITFNNKPFIQHMIEYWQTYNKKIILIINSSYYDLVKFYVSDYFDVKIICFDGITGTADTIHKSITEEYYNKNILFTWCDILPNHSIDLQKLNDTTIFTYGNECRYITSNNSVIKNNNGNIIGIYYIKNYIGINKYVIGDDICDVFNSNFSNFYEYNLTSLTDIGDLVKLRKYNNQNIYKTRFFNEIQVVNNNILLKQSTNEQGNNIIKKEINWYTNLEISGLTPKIYKIDAYSFKMDNLHFQPLFHYFDTFNKEKQLQIVNMFISNLDKLHQHKQQVVSIESLHKDLYIECYEKVITRISKIKPVIDYFHNTNNIISVNGLVIKDIQYVINKCHNIIKTNLLPNYSFIHGDCQFSNTLYDIDNNKLYMIDPRGYFGNTLLYGAAEYDYAKLLYALSGYDKFNNNDEYSVDNIINGNLILNIDNYDYLYDLLPSNIYNKTTVALLVIIWLSLTQYNSNNVLKCITAYYYGLYLFSKYIEILS
jgi:D-arabinose 5-phosphate isomerase GutQ/beta-phosphoglucomutase-like phosphatase (HAD superfamily)/NDP-sugar pyrophosphorylase family protein